MFFGIMRDMETSQDEKLPDLPPELAAILSACEGEIARLKRERDAAKAEESKKQD